MNFNRWFFMMVAVIGIVLSTSSPTLAQSAARKPNILVIWGDDIGIHNISAYNLGVMG